MKKSITVTFNTSKSEQGHPCTKMSVHFEGQMTGEEAIAMLATAIIQITKE